MSSEIMLDQREAENNKELAFREKEEEWLALTPEQVMNDFGITCGKNNLHPSTCAMIAKIKNAQKNRPHKYRDNGRTLATLERLGRGALDNGRL